MFGKGNGDLAALNGLPNTYLDELYFEMNY